MSQLPNGWRVVKLGELAEYLNGAAFKPDDWGDEGMPIIRIQNLTDPDKPMNRTTRAIDEQLRVRNGDILVSWSATLDAFIWDRGEAWLNQHIFRVLPRERVVDKRFLFFLLRREIASLIESEHLHGSTMRHINRGPFLSHQVALPPLDEQRRIVAKLDALFARLRRARTELERVPGLVERAKQAVLAKAFEQATQLAVRHTTIGELAAQVRNGVAKRPENQPPGIPILKISAIRSMVVRMDERRYYVLEPGEDVSSYGLQAGDLLFTRYNGNPELVANCGLVREVDGLLIYPDKLIRVRLNNEVVEPRFVEALVASNPVKDALAPYIKSAAGQHGIAGSDLKLLSLPLPTLSEQTKIVIEIEAAFARIDRMAAEAARATALLDRLEQATLAKAFRGELVGAEKEEIDTMLAGMPVGNGSAADGKPVQLGVKLNSEL